VEGTQGKVGKGEGRKGGEGRDGRREKGKGMGWPYHFLKRAAAPDSINHRRSGEPRTQTCM
jgi:hypothetical protein